MATVMLRLLNEDVECVESEAWEDAGVDVINLPVDSHTSADFQASPCSGIPLP